MMSLVNQIEEYVDETMAQNEKLQAENKKLKHALSEINIYLEPTIEHYDREDIIEFLTDVIDRLDVSIK